MIKDVKIFEKIISPFIYTAVFIGSLFNPLDPDLGWHLKYGQHFFEKGGVLRDNTFSALMPDYKWSNSSWATDLLSYQTFDNFGFLGLTILGAIVITLTFFFIGKAAKLDLFEKSLIFPFIYYFTLPVNQISFRGQLLSLLFIAMMFYLLSLYSEKNKKVVLLLIPLFVLWSNFHGEFILGLGLLGIWAVVYLAKEIYLNYKKDFRSLFNKEKFLILAIIGSALGSLINPFGIGIYLETLKHFGDPMQKSVAEWISPDDFSTIWWHQLLTGTILVLGMAMIGVGKKALDMLPFHVPSLVLFIFTFWIRRYAWPFYYSSVFLFKPVVNFLKPDNPRQIVLMSGFFTALFLGLIIYSKYPFDNLRNMNWDEYCRSSVHCSPTAAKAVIDNKLNNDNLLTIYDYGGWLIWNYPQIKPTIDGRMHLWRNEAGYSAFEYYYPIEQNIATTIDESRYNAVLTSKRKPIYETLKKLHDEGKWRAIHVDKYSALFVRVL